MNNFYFKDYESLMTEWNRLDKLRKSLKSRSPSILKLLGNYKKEYSTIDGSKHMKVVDGKLVRWDTRTDKAFDRKTAVEYVINQYNKEYYGTETPDKDFEYVDTLKKYYELKGYKEGTYKFTPGGSTSALNSFEARNKLNIFGQREVTEGGQTGLDIKIDNKLKGLVKDSGSIFEDTSYFDKNIDAILNKNTENSVSLKDGSVNNRTKLLTSSNIALDKSVNSNLTRELAINPVDA